MQSRGKEGDKNRAGLGFAQQILEGAHQLECQIELAPKSK